MEKEGLDSARSICERALNVINYRLDNEKLNLWTAYFNLEYNFGEPTLFGKYFLLF